MNLTFKLPKDVKLFNSSTPVIEETQLYTMYPAYFFTFSITLTLVFILGFVLNIVTILSIVSARAYTYINMLILNLAIGDFVYTLGVPMFAAQVFSRSWLFGSFGCKLFIFTEFFGIIVGILTVTALSVERFFVISSSRSRIGTMNKSIRICTTLFYIFTTWTIALSFSLLMISSIRLGGKDGAYSCQSIWSDDQIKSFFFIKLVFIFFIPYALITVSSTKLLIFLSLWRSRRNCSLKIPEDINLDESRMMTTNPVSAENTAFENGYTVTCTVDRSTTPRLNGQQQQQQQESISAARPKASKTVRMQDAVNDSEQTLKADTTPYEITAITHGSLVQHLTKQKSWSERNMEDEVRDISSDVTVNNPSMLKDTYCDISKHEDSMSENVPAPNNRRAQMRLKNHQKNVSHF